MNIEKNIPAPDRYKTPYPLMEVGDSVLVKTERERSGAHAYGKMTGKKFTTRSEKNGFRVWRIE